MPVEKEGARPMENISSSSQGVYRQSPLERVAHGMPFDDALRHEVDLAGVSRVFVLGSRKAAESVSMQRLQSALGRRFVGAYCNVAAHVPADCVIEAAIAAKAANADHLVALGGGSVVDAAKGVALCLKANLGSREALLGVLAAEAADPGPWSVQDGPWLRITAIPVSLSVAEFTGIAGITDPEKRVKHIIAHPGMSPRSVIFDPALTLPVPLRIFLASGVKAMDHAAERLASMGSHPLMDAVCTQALQMLAQALPAVTRAPDDLSLRLQCQLGAWMSIHGSAEGVRMGASHALGHVLGAHANVPHGLTSCVLLPSVMRWNHPVNAERQRRVSAALGSRDTAGDALEKLIRGLGLPARLNELGVAREDLEWVARKSLQDPGMKFNPRKVESVDDARAILEMAW